MKQLIVGTLFILLLTTFALASDPPSETIGVQQYSVSVPYSGTMLSNPIGYGDDQTYICSGHIEGEASGLYNGSAQVNGFMGVVSTSTFGDDTAPSYCNVLLTVSDYTSHTSGTITESVFLNDGENYHITIDPLGGSWETSTTYYLSVGTPANGNGGN